jgi:hypothetical protein
VDCFCVGDEALYYETFVRGILEGGEEFLEAFGEGFGCEGFAVGFGVYDVGLLFWIPDLHRVSTQIEPTGVERKAP